MKEYNVCLTEEEIVNLKDLISSMLAGYDVCICSNHLDDLKFYSKLWEKLNSSL